MPEKNLWRVISGNFMDIAATEWCKLFGSDSEAVQWKNNVPEREWKAFREGFHQATGLTLEEWETYREEIKSYQDKHAAHFDLENFAPGTATYPQYDSTLKACFFYLRANSETARRKRHRAYLPA